MKTRFARIISLIFLLLLVACQPQPEKKAEQLAREYMTTVIGESAVDRSAIEVRPSAVGWMVIFRNAHASCDEAILWRGACRDGNREFRDVYACVERNWMIRQIGGTGDSIGEEDLCQTPATEAPTAKPNP